LKHLVAFMLLALPLLGQNGVSYSTNQQHIWNGSYLLDLYSTDGITCDHWAMWYFRAGESQAPGTQWGSASGKTAGDVLKQWEESKKTDQAWKDEWTKYHMTWKQSSMTYDNALGPICVSEAAFNTTPEVAQKLDELTTVAHEASGLIEDVRESVNFTAALATERGKTPTIYDKTSVEEFLGNISELPQKILETRRMVLDKIDPNMVFLSSQLTAFSKMLDEGKARKDMLAKRYPAPPKPGSQPGIGAWTVFEEKGTPKPTTCRVPSFDHLIISNDGHMDHRTGGQVDWVRDTDWVCESGVHFTRHCADNVQQDPVTKDSCVEIGRP
jgi:hypothetical protein